LDGEAATGAERAAFQLTNEFLQLMLDPFVNGRTNAALGSPAIGFAPDRQESLPPDIALAYASILNKASPMTSFDQRWSAWGSAYGGSNSANGDPAAGSSNVTARTFGFAAGMDYHFTPDTVAGFALAGAGTNWNLATTPGNGRSDAFQVGVYGITHAGPAYLAGALAFTNHWFTTNRSALGDQLTANFTGQSYGARLEGGYRYAVLPAFAVTPYGAVQFQDFNTPAYSEADVSGGGFGLSYNAMNATDVRSELGARFDDPTLVYNKPLILFGRVAWAHDFVSNPLLSAAFETLPGGSFTVNGAPIPHDSALTTAGAQLFLTPSWTLLAKFEGEFAPARRLMPAPVHCATRGNGINWRLGATNHSRQARRGPGGVGSAEACVPGRGGSRCNRGPPVQKRTTDRHASALSLYSSEAAGGSCKMRSPASPRHRRASRLARLNACTGGQRLQLARLSADVIQKCAPKHYRKVFARDGYERTE